MKKNKLIIAVDLSSKVSGVSVFVDSKYDKSYLIKMKSLKELSLIDYAKELYIEIARIIRNYDFDNINIIEFIFEENKKHSSICIALGIWCGVIEKLNDFIFIETSTVHPKTWYRDLKLGAWNDTSQERKKASLNYYNTKTNSNETNDNISDSYCIGKWFMERRQNDNNKYD